MCDIFIIVEEIDLANYADCNTPFVSGDTSDVLESLENELSKRFGLFLSRWRQTLILTSAATSSTTKIKEFSPDHIERTTWYQFLKDKNKKRTTWKLSM